MKFSNIILSSALVTVIPGALAHPGAVWKKKLAELEARMAAPIDSPEDSNELLGDLITPGPTTAVGKLIADMILGKVDATSTEIVTAAIAPLGSAACKADTCCAWKYVADDMLQMFKGQSLRCNSFARGAIRLGFHDAAAWAKGLDHGGADGSILLTDELNRPANNGLQEIAALTKTMYAKYQPYGIGMADLIQMGANVATVACPLGPRVRSFVGRKDNPTPAQDGLLPDVNANVDSLIQLFEDKTIRPHGLVALVGAHSTSQQRFFNPQRALDPQDSTPGEWDVLFYNQTLDPNAPKRVLKFPSDVAFSTHPRMMSEWVAFTDPKSGQAHWNDDYAKEYVRLSILGINNINNLTECTKVLPPAITTFNPPDKSVIDAWANGGFQSLGSKFGQLMADAQTTTNQTLPNLGVDPQQALAGLGLAPPGPPSAQPNWPNQPKAGQGQNAPSSQPQSARPPPPQNPSPTPLLAPVGSALAPVVSAVAPIAKAPAASAAPAANATAAYPAAPAVNATAAVPTASSQAPVASTLVVLSSAKSSIYATPAASTLVVPSSAKASLSTVPTASVKPIVTPVVVSSAKPLITAAPASTSAASAIPLLVSSAPAPVAAAPPPPAVAAPKPAPPPQENGWPMSWWGQGWSSPSPTANNGPAWPPQGGSPQSWGQGGTYRKLRFARAIWGKP